MRYAIDARISNREPRLRIFDADSGRIYFQWTLNRIQKPFSEDHIAKEDFLKSERYGMQYLVKNLFLISCVEELYPSGQLVPMLSTKTGVLMVRKNHQPYSLLSQYLIDPDK